MAGTKEVMATFDEDVVDPELAEEEKLVRLTEFMRQDFATEMALVFYYLRGKSRDENAADEAVQISMPCQLQNMATTFRVATIFHLLSSYRKLRLAKRHHAECIKLYAGLCAGAFYALPQEGLKGFRVAVKRLGQDSFVQFPKSRAGRVPVVIDLATV